jgi:hypothetical protein
MEDALRNAFDCKPSKNLDDDRTTFLWIELSKTSFGYAADMVGYIHRLNDILAGDNFEVYRRLRAQLLWLANARPDLCAFVSLASSVTSSSFCRLDVSMINSRVQYLKRTRDIQLRYPHLDVANLRLLVYADASWRASYASDSSSDGASQVGYVVLLADDASCCFLDFHSGKARRVARSSMAAETLAFAQAFDAAFALRHQLFEMLGREVPILMHTDSAALFDAITRYKRTTEARLMIDIHAVREAYRRKELHNVALIRSEYNIADAMTRYRVMQHCCNASGRTKCVIPWNSM